MTPRELVALWERALERERRADARAGVVAATLVNIHQKKGSRPYEPKHFFPSLDNRRKGARAQSADERRAIMLLLGETMGWGVGKHGRPGGIYVNGEPPAVAQD